MAKYEGRDDVQRRRAQNKQTEEFYKTAYEEGINPDNWRYDSDNARAKYLSDVKSRNQQKEYAANLQKIRDEQVARLRGNYEGGRYSVERASRRIEPSKSTAVSRLNAYNESYERRNDYMAKELARIERQQAAERRRTMDLAVTSKKRRNRGGGKKN